MASKRKSFESKQWYIDLVSEGYKLFSSNGKPFCINVGGKPLALGNITDVVVQDSKENSFKVICTFYFNNTVICPKKFLHDK